MLCVGLAVAPLSACPREAAPRTSGTAAEAPASPFEARGEAIVDQFTDEQLLVLLDRLGHEGSVVTDGSITFSFDIGRVLLFNQWDGDLQLYYVMTGGEWTHEAVNTWNRTRRLTRAYIDEDGDLVLESDLLSLGGLTERQVTSFVAVFERALDLFVREVAGLGVERPAGEEPREGGWH